MVLSAVRVSVPVISGRLDPAVWLEPAMVISQEFTAMRTE